MVVLRRGRQLEERKANSFPLQERSSPTASLKVCVCGLFFSFFLTSFTPWGKEFFSVVFECLENEPITRDEESSLGPLVGPWDSLDLSTDPNPVDGWP